MSEQQEELAARRAIYQAAMFERVTPQDWAEIVARALADALEGDAEARAFLAEYVAPGVELRLPTVTGPGRVVVSVECHKTEEVTE